VTLGKEKRRRLLRKKGLPAGDGRMPRTSVIGKTDKGAGKGRRERGGKPSGGGVCEAAPRLPGGDVYGADLLGKKSSSCGTMRHSLSPRRRKRDPCRLEKRRRREKRERAREKETIEKPAAKGIRQGRQVWRRGGCRCVGGKGIAICRDWGDVRLGVIGAVWTLCRGGEKMDDGVVSFRGDG